MLDVTVERLAEYKSTDSPPSLKCNVLRESLSVDSKYSLRNTKEKGDVGNLGISRVNHSKSRW
jgi:hypothetical protein